MALQKKLGLALVVMCFAALVGGRAQAADTDVYSIFTAHLPPWSMKGQNGTLYRVVEEIELRRGSYTFIENVPWIRAQSWAETRDDVVIFPLSRTKAREKKYQWIAPLIPMELVFASFGPVPRDLEDARDLVSIGALARTPSEQFLKSNGFRNIEASTRGAKSLVQWLQKGRINAWFEARAIIKHSLAHIPASSQVRFSKPVFSADLYIAGSPKLSKAIIADYRRILDEMRADGSFFELSRMRSPDCISATC